MRPLFRAVMDSISRWLVGSSRTSTLAAGDHHLGEQAADFFSSGEDFDFLHTVVAGEEHSSQEAADIGGILDLGELGQPVNDDQIVVEFFRAVLREISLAGGHAPFIASLVGLHLSGENLEEGGFCKFVSADESNLVVMAEDEGDVVQNLHAVDGLADAFYGEHFISDFAVGTEINIGIFTAGRTDLIQLDFFQGTFTGS